MQPGQGRAAARPGSVPWRETVDDPLAGPESQSQAAVVLRIQVVGGLESLLGTRLQFDTTVGNGGTLANASDCDSQPGPSGYYAYLKLS